MVRHESLRMDGSYHLQARASGAASAVCIELLGRDEVGTAAEVRLPSLRLHTPMCYGRRLRVLLHPSVCWVPRDYRFLASLE
jgi:hypothetical protein